MQLCGSLNILWHCFLWGWNENCPFPVLWPQLSFPNLLAYWVQHFHSIIFQDLKQLNWNSHLFQNVPQFIVIHTVKCFGIVNNAEIDVFLELSCFFDDPAYVGNLISGSSAFSKSSLNIWKFSVHILLKPSSENFEHYFVSMRDECSCVVVWAFFGSAFLWDWNENWPFPVLWPLLSLPNLLAYWVQHFHSIIFKVLK